MLSSIASSPPRCAGWWNAGITAPVMTRMRLVRAATADRNTQGFGEWPP
jgi:hypothetical protein